MIINNVIVEADTTFFSADELKRYVKHVSDKVSPATLIKIRMVLCDDGKVDVDWETHDNFERIRRITGYLTGDLNSWNNAKRSEERERVKHGVEDYEDD